MRIILLLVLSINTCFAMDSRYLVVKSQKDNCAKFGNQYQSTPRYGSRYNDYLITKQRYNHNIITKPYYGRLFR